MSNKLTVCATVIFLAGWLSPDRAASQTQFTLTITTAGLNAGSVAIVPLGTPCSPLGGGTCEFTVSSGTELRLMANAPQTPGVFSRGTGSASHCAASTCAFTMTENSSVTATFDAAFGSFFRSLTIQLAGTARGSVGADNSGCQGNPGSTCTTVYWVDSLATLQAFPQNGTVFTGFSNGTGDAAVCSNLTRDCVFRLLNPSSVTASFAPGGPAVLIVPIDVKPGSFPNSINAASGGRIPVAILSAERFSAPAEVDRSSLTFGRTGSERSLEFCNPNGEDVNQDGRPDLVCHFNTRAAAFVAGTTRAILKGRTVTGTAMEGSDFVRIVP